jgi:glycosyltransferase involved in cell wall biosynthesis
MKILYLHQYFITPDMAGGTRSYEMARRLVAMGHEVHMITTWFDGPSPDNLKGWFVRQIDGITVHYLPLPYSNRFGFGRRILAFMRFSIQATRKAIKVSGDLVFATSTPLTIAIPAVLAKRKLGVPMVFEVRDLWPDMPIAVGALRNPVLIRLARWLEQFAYRNATRVVALSPGMVEGVVRGGYPRDRIAEIPNSADLGLFDTSRVTSEEFLALNPQLRETKIVLYAGTLGFVNGVGWLADLAAAMKAVRPDVRFVVIGDGAEREEIRTRAEALGVLDDNFLMLARLPKRSIVSAYAAASMVLSLFRDIPEMRANSANKFFDGLAAGRPVAINYQGWQADLLNESGAGIVMGQDVPLAANRLSLALGSSAELARMGKAARQLAEQRFSRDELAAKLERVLCAAAEHVSVRNPESVESERVARER